MSNIPISENEALRQRMEEIMKRVPGEAIIIDRTDWRRPDKNNPRDLSAFQRDSQAIFRCPKCSMEQCLSPKHEVSFKGEVSPSCKCPNPKCGLEAIILLRGWKHKPLNAEAAFSNETRRPVNDRGH